LKQVNYSLDPMYRDFTVAEKCTLCSDLLHALDKLSHDEVRFTAFYILGALSDICRRHPESTIAIDVVLEELLRLTAAPAAVPAAPPQAPASYLDASMLVRPSAYDSIDSYLSAVAAKVKELNNGQ